MKIPVILAQEPVARPAQPRSYGASGAGQGEAAIGQSLMGLSTALGQLGAVQARAAKALRNAEAQVEYDETISRVKQEFADRDIARQQAGMDPDRYPDQLEADLRDIEQNAARGMKYPESRALLTRGAVVVRQAGRHGWLEVGCVRRASVARGE